jgi:ATP-dependent Clp protease ATP-binding subunit ClpA
LNRIDKTIVFEPLSKESIRKIVEIQIADLKKRLLGIRLSISVNKETKDWIAEKGYTPEFGARPIRKVISDYIETAISEGILKEEFSSDDKIQISVKDDAIKLIKVKI